MNQLTSALGGKGLVNTFTNFCTNVLLSALHQVAGFCHTINDYFPAIARCYEV